MVGWLVVVGVEADKTAGAGRALGARALGGHRGADSATSKQSNLGSAEKIPVTRDD